MRWVIAFACVGTACGRLAFDEVALVAPDAAADSPTAQCTKFDFDQLPPGFLPVENGGTIMATAGVVSFSISGAMGSECWLESMGATSFIGYATSVQAVPTTTLTVSSSIGWHQVGGEQIGVHLEADGTNIKLNSFNATTTEYMEYVAVPYDPQAHAFWQLREQNTEIVAETSPDGLTWSKLGSVVGLDLATMKWDFGIGSYVQSTAPSTTMDNATECPP